MRRHGRPTSTSSSVLASKSLAAANEENVQIKIINLNVEHFSSKKETDANSERFSV